MERLHATAIAHDPAAVTSWALVLHGIYGRGRNWASVARLVAARRPAWGFWLVDLRLHGASPAMAPPHTVAGAAGDVVALVPTLTGGGSVRALVGHSFGGKVVLAAAAALADSVEQCWIVDSTPEVRAPGGSAWTMLEIVRSLPGPFASRADGVSALEARGLSAGVAAWMATNLTRGERGFTWAIDPDALESLLRDFFADDEWAVVERPPGRMSLHFVKADASSTLSEPACTRLEQLARVTSRVHLHRIAGGHWVNTENPEAMVELLAARLPQEMGK